jgi:hypothetical protein
MDAYENRFGHLPYQIGWLQNGRGKGEEEKKCGRCLANELNDKDKEDTIRVFYSE